MDTFRRVFVSILSSMILVAILVGSSAIGEDESPSAQAGVQELTRGPIHEAFAAPVVFNPKPGPIVPKEPPKPLEELPPEHKPEGDNVAFIAGYWAYDQEKDTFLYVSGIWRAIPPGKEWVGGYWTKVDAGWQWVSGYWKSVAATPAAKTEVQYYPEPPASVEAGPNADPPSANYIWVPGHFFWHHDHYVWRGGYWIAAQPEWVWVPAHYVWTPCGYVFVEGYWDYVVQRRGVIFAPCYIEPVVYLQPNYFYCPHLVIDIDLCFDHLFVHPHHHHYCFGDWYGDAYFGMGIYPWFHFHNMHGHYCPMYAHAHWFHSQHNPMWAISLRQNHAHYISHAEQRPLRTFAQQQTLIKSLEAKKGVPAADINKLKLAKSLTQVAKGDVKGQLKFEKITAADRKQLTLKANDVRKLSTERLSLEMKASKDFKALADKKPSSKQVKPLTLELPKSSVVSKAPEKLAKKDTPPPLPLATFKPADDKSVKKPGEDKPPVTKKPTEDKPPVTKKPTEDKPLVTKKPTEDKPPVKKPTEDKPPVIKKPTEDKPPVIKKPSEGKPPVKKPGESKPPKKPGDGESGPPLSDGEAD